MSQWLQTTALASKTSLVTAQAFRVDIDPRRGTESVRGRDQPVSRTGAQKSTTWLPEAEASVTYIWHIQSNTKLPGLPVRLCSNSCPGVYSGRRLLLLEDTWHLPHLQDPFCTERALRACTPYSESHGSFTAVSRAIADAATSLTVSAGGF